MEEPLVIYGPASLRYDFGPAHPLTPRRFGPGIELLAAAGATRFEEPRIATDDELAPIHDPRYVAAVRRLSSAPGTAPGWGFSAWGDDPPFAGMHEAAATVAGGSLAAMEAILARTASRAFHPGGGLHHAMPARASGFCIYNDVALAIARARDVGERVLYVDLDVHHGDGVQAAFWDEPAVLTLSLHETGDALFPGTGRVDETGGEHAPGRSVNVPLLPGTGDGSWLAALETLLPPLVEAFRPTLLVSQHGSDGHALDPLAHLHLTTAGIHRADRLLASIADRLPRRRWLATGGGGYDAYRVVPRAWALAWSAQAGIEPPEETPQPWRERWSADAARHRQGPPPVPLLDPPGTAAAEDAAVTTANRRTVERALRLALARLGT